MTLFYLAYLISIFLFLYVSNFNSGRFFPLGDIWQYMETFIVSTTGEDGTTVSIHDMALCSETVQNNYTISLLKIKSKKDKLWFPLLK